MKHSKYISNAIQLFFALGLGLVIAFSCVGLLDRCLNRYKCMIDNDRGWVKLHTHRYDERFEIKVCDEHHNKAENQARIEQGKVLNSPYVMLDSEITARTWEILREWHEQ